MAAAAVGEEEETAQKNIAEVVLVDSEAVAAVAVEDNTAAAAVAGIGQEVELEKDMIVAVGNLNSTAVAAAAAGIVEVAAHRQKDKLKRTADAKKVLR